MAHPRARVRMRAHFGFHETIGRKTLDKECAICKNSLARVNGNATNLQSLLVCYGGGLLSGCFQFFLSGGALSGSLVFILTGWIQFWRIGAPIVKFYVFSPFRGKGQDRLAKIEVFWQRFEILYIANLICSIL